MTFKNKTRFGAALASAALFVTSMAPARAGIFSISEQDEIRAGREMQNEVERKYGRALSGNDPRSRRVKAIGAQFARLSTRRNIPYSYTVLKNDKELNAFAGPGGPIYVTTKLLSVVGNDAELAYVLGHETAHIERRHIVKQAEKQQQAGIIAGIAGAILGGRNNSNTIGILANLGWAVISTGYSRKDENDSDAVGVRMMARLGYDPRAAVSMLGKLGNSGGGFLSSHPAPKSRQQTVSALITKEKLLDMAKRGGGPRLSSTVNYGGDSAYDDNAYDDDYARNNSRPSRYPADTGYDEPMGGAPEYSDDNYRDTDRRDEVSFGAPVMIRATGAQDIVMAPLSGFARWANATTTRSGNEIVMRRAGWTMTMRRFSSVIFYQRASGREDNVTMEVPVVENGGELYAPLSWLMKGLGGSADFEQSGRSVNLSFPDGKSGVLRLS